MQPLSGRGVSHSPLYTGPAAPYHESTTTLPSDDITTTQTYSTTTPPERALLVGLDSGGRNVRFSVHDSLDELAQLAATAGAQVAAVYTQSREAPSPSHYLGKGKLREVTEGLEQHQANLVLFDDELSPTQQRNLENALKVKVLDRAAVILDIFAGRAHTREGRLQVELAQYQYLLPRLAGQWSHLERLGGGIGTRGPGETQIETDRRLIRNRIERLKDDLDDVRRHRSLYRRRRSVQGVPVVALVGYTNAGKSTLMNAIAGADVLAEDKLFATLDPTTRKIKLPSQREILLTDTVGFIQKLPTNLVAAFRATLEELTEAALLLHVFDISHPKAQEQVETAEQVLGELGVTDRPVLYLANKVDLATQYLPGGTTAAMTAIAEDITIPMEGDREAVVVSAKKGWGLRQLLDKITEKLGEDMAAVTVCIPYGAPKLLHLFRRYGQVLAEKHTEEGTVLTGRIPHHLEPRFAAYAVARRNGRRPAPARRSTPQDASP